MRNVTPLRAPGDSFEADLTCEQASRAGRSRKIAGALEVLCCGSAATVNVEPASSEREISAYVRWSAKRDLELEADCPDTTTRRSLEGYSQMLQSSR